MSQAKESFMPPAEYQKHVTEIGRKEISLMPKGSPEQFSLSKAPTIRNNYGG